MFIHVPGRVSWIAIAIDDFPDLGAPFKTTIWPGRWASATPFRLTHALRLRVLTATLAHAMMRPPEVVASNELVDHENSELESGHDPSMGADDSTLWRRSRAGDVGAFGVLFERHAAEIYNYCFRRVGDWSIAEDLLSVVFLEAWRRREKELPHDKVLPWLYGIATNVVRNQRRSQRRYAAALKRVPAPRSDQGFTELADVRVDDDRQMRHVLTLIRKLPRREQEVFALCGWFELNYEDAALALDVPVGTVRSRLSRARARLRELDPTHGHEDETHAKAGQEVMEP